jgi:hypothetical protein
MSEQVRQTESSGMMQAVSVADYIVERLRQSAPWLRKMSATFSLGRGTAAGLCFGSRPPLDQ